MENEKTAYTQSNQPCRCTRCDWNWTTRKPGVSKVCPRCRSENWNIAGPARPRAQRSPGQRGAPMKYPQIATLAEGQEIFIGFPILPNGDRDPHELRNMHQSIRKWCRRAGWKINIRPEVRGLNIYRIPTVTPTDQLI